MPLPASPGRSGFTPQLSLSYNSGSGNGPFGLGWSLGVPAITRSTDKGIPRYVDAEESDTYLISGAEDLVCVLGADGSPFEDPASPPGYRVHRYRPRIEGLFARIERWTNLASGEIHWRSISRDNVTTLYGTDDESRIFDPLHADRAARTFSWLIRETYDDKGNAIIYGYKTEDSAGVDDRLAHEVNRARAVRTVNRYLKSVRYGNTISRLDVFRWPGTAWLFELVFDYGEHSSASPAPNDAGTWLCRNDPFSSYRSGFEIRTYRLCQRVLMFHHFPLEPEVGVNCLVRALEMKYRSNRGVATDAQRGHPVASFLESVTQYGCRRRAGSYLWRPVPPLEFGYSNAVVDEQVRNVSAASLENLPTGLESPRYQWIDLFGEGVSGVLSEQGQAWFYKRNLSPAGKEGAARPEVRIGAAERVGGTPNIGLSFGAQFLDLAGDGHPDIAVMQQPFAGFFEIEANEESWAPLRTFRSLPNLSFDDPNLRFIDLDGDGLADILVTEDSVLTWYRSLGEEGFDGPNRVAKPDDERRGPAIVFADGSQSIYLADMSGDGLTDIVRIRNGEICYWPNLGYGRFGMRVAMDNCPHFDSPDQFDPRRLILADIDGSGNTDLIYLSLAPQQTRLYFNQAGNAWSDPRTISGTPTAHPLGSVQAVDLFGFGTASLVWSSSLPGLAGRQLQYIDLMGGKKPHLLERIANNLGAETRIEYASSAKFYVQDKLAGTPWITRLPFPVQVVERVETSERISGTRFVSRYAYHHGHFCPFEREFRGFGMVEQWDTEEFAALADPARPPATNIDAASHVPPVWTKTWFHTGVYLGRDRVSNFFAGLVNGSDRGGYYREPAWRDDDVEASRRLLPDTTLPETLLNLDGTRTPHRLSIDEEREACRALRGSVLRHEVYSSDGTARAAHPYTALEQNFTVELLQRKGANENAVFLTHARETIHYHYEREPSNPRIQHDVTLETDAFGNVLSSMAIAYGRRAVDATILDARDRDEQLRHFATGSENRYTGYVSTADAWRTPLPSETHSYELTGFTLAGAALRLDFESARQAVAAATTHDYETTPAPGAPRKRLIEHERTLYRRDNLSGPLPLHGLQPLALPHESYRLAYSPGLVAEAFGGLVDPSMLANEGGYVHFDGDANWWSPSGRFFFSADTNHTAADELDYARAHFFLPKRYRDPFHSTANPTEAIVSHDRHDLFVQETRDAFGNRMTVGERHLDPTQPLVRHGHDYRTLQPCLLMDANRNRVGVAFDALGMVVATAVMGKPEEQVGDTLTGFAADLDEATVAAHMSDPYALVDPNADPYAALGNASTRLIYDLFAYRRTTASVAPQPAAVYTLARETHVSQQQGTSRARLRHSFAYSDGLGREIQNKSQAEPGPVPQRDAITGSILFDGAQPRMSANSVAVRWVGGGWTVFNNKGLPVRQFEPYFTDRHAFEADVRAGVSPILFYDPVGRIVATLHPNHAWEKIVFDAWKQATWDVNDTVGQANPSADLDVGGYFARLPAADYLPTWFTRRDGGVLGLREQAAARAALIHSDTPTLSYLDAMGRNFVTVAHNRFKFSTAPAAAAPTVARYRTRVVTDIEGNQREVIDAKDRVVVRYAYDMLGNRARHESMEGGTRWMLADVAGMPVRAWDSRGHHFRTVYDRMRRPIRQFVRGTDAARSDPRTLNPVRPEGLLVERIEYGEGAAGDIQFNLRNRVLRTFDASGVSTSEAYDFKGKVVRSSRQLASAYKGIPDWGGSVVLEEDIYRSSTDYDALDRPIQVVAPHSGSAVDVIQPTYDEGNLLQQLDAWFKQPGLPTGLLPADTASHRFVTRIDRDPKGQRTAIFYGNGAETRYRYDRETYRLARLYTRRGAAFTDDCDNPAPPPPPRIAAPADPDTLPAGTACGLQNLHYTYDAAGNITHIHDDAQAAIYFRNQRVDAHSDYNYDATYRLIEATGREHLGQAAGAPAAHSHSDAPRVGRVLLAPNDGNAMGRYRESYEYDEVGNFLNMIHAGTDPLNAGWTRNYTYNEDSLLGPGKSNRLTSTAIGVATDTYSVSGDGYDAHGNMLRMPQLQVIEWDYKDRMRTTQRQAVNAQDADGVARNGERTYYVYDSSGQRVRKITELAASTPENPRIKEERIYLGGFEIYRRVDGGALTRETLHVTDDNARIALVETRTVGEETGVPERLIRYQLRNHLGSATCELDDQAQIISYEEYTPYGSTSYQGVRSQAGAPRYRFTGQERDEESGLGYHGARYCAPWLGRWIAPDSAGLVDGTNTYSYVGTRPTSAVDPTGMASDPAPKILNDIDDVVDFEVREAAFEAGKDMQTGKETAKSKKQPLPPPTGEQLDEIAKDTKQGKRLRTKYAAEQGRVAGEKLQENVKTRSKAAATRSKDVPNFGDSSGRLVPEITLDKGKVTKVDVAPGGQRSGARTADLGVTKDPISPDDWKSLEGKAAPSVLDETRDMKVSESYVGDKPGFNKQSGGVPVTEARPWSNIKGKVAAAVDTVSDSNFVQKVMKSKVLKVAIAVAPILASGVAKATPIVGLAVGAQGVASEVSQGNVRRGVLEGIGMSEIPIVSQVADIGLAVEDAGWAAKEILDPEQKLEQWYYNTFLK